MTLQTPISSSSLYQSPLNPFTSFDNNYPPCRGSSESLSTVKDPHLPLSFITIGCAVAAGDTIYFACIPFNMFDYTGGDALPETFLDSVMLEMVDPFSAVPSFVSQGL